MGEQVIALKALIRQRHMTYDAFCREWDRIAGKVEKRLIGRYPGHAQFYRWLKGELRQGRPYPDACGMLEKMFPGWTVDALFAPYDQSIPGRQVPTQSKIFPVGEGGGLVSSEHFDLAAIYTSRPHFLSAVPLFGMIEAASTVRASGLSLNLLTQHFSDEQMRRLISSGTRFQLLFVNPESEAMRLREQEEGYEPGFLGGLTDMNIKIMQEKVKKQLKADEQPRIEIGVSNEIIRFNIILVDDRIGVIQPYLPSARGVDSPTFFIETTSTCDSLFRIFDQVFTSLWERASML